MAESHVFLGGFFGNPWQSENIMRILTILATMSVVVTAVYVLRGLGQVFWGPIEDPHFKELRDADLSEKLSTGILLATLIIVGVYPSSIIGLIERAIMPIMNRLTTVNWVTMLN